VTKNEALLIKASAFTASSSYKRKNYISPAEKAMTIKARKTTNLQIESCNLDALG
jgi:hypothetical protein